MSEGEDRPAARIRRRGRRHADQRGARFAGNLLRGRHAARAGDPGRFHAESMAQPLESRRALLDDRPRNLGADGGADHPPRLRRGHRRHDLRAPRVSEGAQSGDPRRGRRPRGLDLLRRYAEGVCRRRDRDVGSARDRQPQGDRRDSAGLRPRVVPHGAPYRARGRPARRRLSGTAAVAAARVAKTLPADALLVVVFPDPAAATCRKSSTTSG